MNFLASNWVVDNLIHALETWNSKLNEIWSLISQSPAEFKDGTIWNAILTIHDAIKAVALGLLVLFFLFGVVKTCGSFAELKKPEHAVKLFVRFILAKTAVTYCLDLLLALFSVVQGVMHRIMETANYTGASEAILPQEIVSAIENVGILQSVLLWAVTLIGSLVIIVLSFILSLTVFGRFFKLYIYTAIAPLPMSTFGGSPTQSIGISFIKSYAGVALEGVVIVLACIIFSLYASAAPSVNPDASATQMIWTYLGELIFNLLVLTFSVKMSDRIIKEMLAL